MFCRSLSSTHKQYTVSRVGYLVGINSTIFKHSRGAYKSK